MVADGRLVVHVAQTFPLAEAKQAHLNQETGHVRGKVVLIP
jgi:enoyl reductase